MNKRGEGASHLLAALDQTGQFVNIEEITNDPLLSNTI